MSKFITRSLLSDNPLCRIEEIDLPNKKVSIYCKGIAIPIKLNFDEIINDPVILANLSSKHASWIGYYFGKYYAFSHIQKNRYDSIFFNLASNHSKKPFNIMMLNRNGDLIYSDTQNTYNAISPINALTNERIISKFSPIQACYIGILTGTSRLEIKKTSYIPDKKVQLRIIK